MKLSTIILLLALVFCVTTARAETKTMTMVVDGKPIITITVSEDTSLFSKAKATVKVLKIEPSS